MKKRRYGSYMFIGEAKTVLSCSEGAEQTSR